MSSKKQQQDWMAESDAHTMAQYEEIVADPARMRRAVNAAKKQAAALSKSANTMQKVASTKRKK